MGQKSYKFKCQDGEERDKWIEILSEISEKQIEESHNQTNSLKLNLNKEKVNEFTQNSSFEFPIGKDEKSKKNRH